MSIKAFPADASVDYSYLSLVGIDVKPCWNCKGEGVIHTTEVKGKWETPTKFVPLTYRGGWVSEHTTVECCVCKGAKRMVVAHVD